MRYGGAVLSCRVAEGEVFEERGTKKKREEGQC